MAKDDISLNDWKTQKMVTNRIKLLADIIVLNSSHPVRRKAIYDLGKIKDNRTIPVLLKAYWEVNKKYHLINGYPHDERYEIVKALRKLNNINLLPKFEKMLEIEQGYTTWEDCNCGHWTKIELMGAIDDLKNKNTKNG